MTRVIHHLLTHNQIVEIRDVLSDVLAVVKATPADQPLSEVPEDTKTYVVELMQVVYGDAALICEAFGIEDQFA